jgi:hypothetical protein
VPLQLLDHLGRRVTGRSTFNAPADAYVCVLLLFDGYRNESCRLAYDRQYLQQTLVNIDPFAAAYRRGRDPRGVGGLLVYTAPVQPTTDRYRFSPSCSHDTPQVDKTALESFIQGLSYGTFLTGSTTWLDPHSRSYGMVAVVLDEFKGRNSFNGTYLTVSAVHREHMGRIFVHELGHAFELADEYEEETYPPCLGSGSNRYPNAVMRDAIEAAPHPPPTTSLDPSAVLVSDVPWGRYLSSPPHVVDHPRRPDWVPHFGIASWTDCTVGRYVDIGGPGGQSQPGLWEGGLHHSFNTFRAEPYCIMRDEHYQVYKPNLPPVRFKLEIGRATVFPVGVEPPPAPPASNCGPSYRVFGEPTRFVQRVGNSFVPYCIACRKWLEYRLGVGATTTDPDEWTAGQTLPVRIAHFQSWLTRHG